ncbi:MAG: hypothetical protein FD189_98 [Elusimicrobia bacterium]|nr:MAG: hypothetical protein FD154_250 [Elusimicrobiota bacterium]KAF0158456.1 MAG: hypothetical protein FD189_98 [Elusimicrobiota bacterium]
MRRLVLALLLSPAAAGAFEPFANFGAPKEEKSLSLDFCRSGLFAILTGDCSPAGKTDRDAVSPKACAEAAALLEDGIKALYPLARVEILEPGSRDEAFNMLARTSIFGFALLGRGDHKGGFLVDGDPFYPDALVCTSPREIFGGFYYHSKYSESAAAPKELRSRVLSRYELVTSPDRAPAGSWPSVCRIPASLVYPTRTFAGRMKTDVRKFLEFLAAEKRRHIARDLKSICSACDHYKSSGHTLAALCPPASDACPSGRVTPSNERAVMRNYCLLTHPEYDTGNRR